jgi:hypothetical protein
MRSAAFTGAGFFATGLNAITTACGDATVSGVDDMFATIGTIAPWTLRTLAIGFFAVNAIS